MSYAYIVRGSEDGNIGVFSSKKRATENAVAYCSDTQDPYDLDVEVDKTTNKYVVFVENKKNRLSADVETFRMEEGCHMTTSFRVYYYFTVREKL